MRNLILVGAIGLMACGGDNAEGGGSSQERVLSGRPIDREKYAQIKKGESSKTDVQRLLGEPYEKKPLANAPPECADAWNYTYSTKRGKMLHVDVAIIAFNPAGVVCAADMQGTDQAMP